MNSIKIRNLTKTYKEDIFRDYNLDIDSGVVLLTGKNGAGKSTLIKCILGLIKYQGIIEINGQLGYIPENYVLPDYVTVETFIKNIALLTNSEYEKYLLDFKLDDKLDEYIINLSKGMKQKLVIIQSLIHNPDIIICDEPINGLDSTLQIEFIKVLSKLSDKTIIISTHYPDLYKEIVTKVIHI